MNVTRNVNANMVIHISHKQEDSYAHVHRQTTSGDTKQV